MYNNIGTTGAYAAEMSEARRLKKSSLYVSCPNTL